MKVKTISASVRFSKQIHQEQGKGGWKTVELSAGGEIDEELENWEEAQYSLYQNLGQQMRKVWNGNNSTETES